MSTVGLIFPRHTTLLDFTFVAKNDQLIYLSMAPGEAAIEK
jgi:hypothetical protein